MFNQATLLRLFPIAISAMVLVYAASVKLLSSTGNTLLWGLAWIELAIAVGLVVSPSRSIPVALSLYSGFVGLLLVLWYLGEKTCNCFGIEGSNIFLPLTIDPFLISILLFSAGERLRKWAFLLCGGMALVGALLAPMFAEYAIINSYSGSIAPTGTTL